MVDYCFQIQVMCEKCVHVFVCITEPVSAEYLKETDIVAMTVTSDPNYATLHGVCKLTEDVCIVCGCCGCHSNKLKGMIVQSFYSSTLNKLQHKLFQLFLV